MRLEWALLGFASVLVLSACSSREGDDTGGGESSVDACSNGRDDDGDGLVDCAEPTCSVHAFCGSSGMDSGIPRQDGAVPARDGHFDAGPSSCSVPLDIVFVIDVSTSMDDEIEQVRMGMSSIWTTAQSLTASTQFGLVVFVDDVEVVNDCMPFTTLDAMQAEFARWRDFTSSNGEPGGSPGMNTDCAENSLDALYAAATQCPWRPGATHIAIHVTDDTFAERPARLAEFIPGLSGDGVAVEHTYAETVAALVMHEVRVGAFAAPGAGEFCGAGTSPNVGQGFHEAYMGMDPIPVATGGRAWSIRDVRAGTLDMAAAINEFATEEYCAPF